MKKILNLAVLTLIASLIACGGTTTSRAKIVNLEFNGFKSEFNLGEEFTTGNLHMIVTYSDDTTQTFSAEELSGLLTVDSSAYNKDAVGEYIIKVTYLRVTGTYTVNVIDPTTTVIAPTADPSAGEYYSGDEVTVTLSTATEGAEIWYTINGGEPTIGGMSLEYDGEIVFNITVTTTIRAKAFKDGMTASGTMVAIYTVVPTPEKTVSVGTQSVVLIRNTAGTATFPVVTANIASGQTGTVEWFNDFEGTIPTEMGGGIIGATVSNVTTNAATVTITADDSVQVSLRFFKVIIDGIESEIAILAILAAADAKFIQAGTQSVPLFAGTAGTASYIITTYNIANGTYAATVETFPATTAFSVQGQVEISGNRGLVTITTTAAPAAADYVLWITIDGQQSLATFLVVNTPETLTVTLGAQVGAIAVGRTGSVTFPVTTVNIANGATGEVRFYSDAAGTNQMPTPPAAAMTLSVSAVSDNAATATVTFLLAPASASTAYIRVFINGTLSNVRPLTIGRGGLL